MAKRTTTTVAVLTHEDVSISLTLLLRDLLRRANGLLGREQFVVSLTGRRGLRRLTQGEVTLRLAPLDATPDYLVVPPFAPGTDPFAARAGEARLIETCHDAGAVVGSACLGALMIAQTGRLDGHTATTHWAWVQRARERFPAVRWDASRMLARSGGFVTAGGFLAAVDLALALVERETARPTSRELGRLVLADSARQHQSIYATSLVDTPTEDPRMQRLERWLQAHLAEAITVDDMAAVCRLEPRTFRRAFGRAYGFSPKKLLQLKRIEKVRTLLRRSDLSLEDVVGQVGVSDVPSFRKVFQRELGVSPAEYRRQIRLHG
jgi:transcriptional regulator GlxA family with amidase domain